MKSFIEEEEEYLLNIIKSCSLICDDVKLIPSSRKELGDYQYNGAMQLAKINKLSPLEIANLIVDKLKVINRYKTVNVANPGFINITFKDESLIDYVNKLNNNIDINYHNENRKKIIMDYGGANVAKALHVGHLRSANIGEALKRLLKSFHNEVLADAHLGDWGRPIGLVMLEIKKRYPDLPYFNPEYNGIYPEESPVTSDDLINFYPIASKKAKEDPEFMEEARDITYRFQKGEKGLTALWHHIMKVSKEDIKNTYDELNTTFEIWEGESDCSKYVEEMTSYLEQKKLIKDSQGAKIIELQTAEDNHEIPPLILVKSNGSHSYETTDLACIWERMKIWNPDEIWYLTDSRQSLHFEQVFRAARLANIVNDNTKLEFVPFGTMNGNDGKPFKTRDGSVMQLNDLLKMVTDECEKRILDNITGQERKEIAKKIGVAAVKYADLIPYRVKDYNFDPIKFSDLQGKTGPYLLYSTIRIRSLLKKAEEQSIKYEKYSKISSDIERKIIIEMLDLRNTLEKSIISKSLNDITDYLYIITNLFNNFYSNIRILTEEDIKKRESWLLLSKVIYDNNMKLLNILGIEVPKRM